ncbi:MAG: hypothetical protein JO071_04700 [Deltaproteobacteria bacterium]|nr:hypothetical protein [Deltaproteobacteria bacterium]
MKSSIIRLVFIIFAITLMVTGAQVAAAVAQEETSSDTVIHRGNTNIFFENAGTSGLASVRYQAFDQFASEHPRIAEALARNPRLIENESYIKSHPALADFLRTHYDVSSDFAENPGNYVDMPLTVAASIKKYPIEPQ